VLGQGKEDLLEGIEGFKGEGPGEDAAGGGWMLLEGCYEIYCNQLNSYVLTW
jgi:hypothetical protein